MFHALNMNRGGIPCIKRSTKLSNHAAIHKDKRTFITRRHNPALCISLYTGLSPRTQARHGGRTLGISNSPNCLRLKGRKNTLQFHRQIVIVSTQRLSIPTDLLIPALLHGLTYTLDVLLAVVFVKIRGFHVRR